MNNESLLMGGIPIAIGILIFIFGILLLDSIYILGYYFMVVGIIGLLIGMLYSFCGDWIIKIIKKVVDWI